MFGEHIEECREKRKKSSDRVSKPESSGGITGKQIGKLTAAITALGGLIYGLIELMNR
jgi:hypothetical protein